MKKNATIGVFFILASSFSLKANAVWSEEQLKALYSSLPNEISCPAAETVSNRAVETYNRAFRIYYSADKSPNQLYFQTSVNMRDKPNPSKLESVTVSVYQGSYAIICSYNSVTFSSPYFEHITPKNFTFKDGGRWTETLRSGASDYSCSGSAEECALQKVAYKAESIKIVSCPTRGDLVNNLENGDKDVKARIFTDVAGNKLEWNMVQDGLYANKNIENLANLSFKNASMRKGLLRVPNYYCSYGTERSKTLVYLLNMDTSLFSAKNTNLWNFQVSPVICKESPEKCAIGRE